MGMMDKAIGASCGFVCHLFFPLGDCSFSLLDGSGGLLKIEPHALADSESTELL